MPQSMARNATHLMRLNTMFGPFRARVFLFFGPPGRCPGLACDCPFGAKSKDPQGVALGWHVIAPLIRTYVWKVGAKSAEPEKRFIAMA